MDPPPDTLGPERAVLVDYSGVLISAVDTQCTMAKHGGSFGSSGIRIKSRGVSAIQGSGLEGCQQFRGLD